MKRAHFTTKPRLTLGDLILAVSSPSGHRREAVAAVADLLERGALRVPANRKHTP